MTPNYDDPDMTPRGGYPDEDFITRYSPINDGYQSPRNGRYDDDYDDRGYRGNGYDYDDYDDRYYDSRDDRYSSYDRNSYDDDGRCYDDNDRNYGSLSRGNSYSPPLMGGSSFDSPQQEHRGMGVQPEQPRLQPDQHGRKTTDPPVGRTRCTRRDRGWCAVRRTTRASPGEEAATIRTPPTTRRAVATPTPNPCTIILNPGRIPLHNTDHSLS